MYESCSLRDHKFTVGHEYEHINSEKGGGGRTVGGTKNDVPYPLENMFSVRCIRNYFSGTGHICQVYIGATGKSQGKKKTQKCVVSELLK